MLARFADLGPLALDARIRCGQQHHVASTTSAVISTIAKHLNDVLAMGSIEKFSEPFAPELDRDDAAGIWARLTIGATAAPAVRNTVFQDRFDVNHARPRFPCAHHAISERNVPDGQPHRRCGKRHIMVCVCELISAYQVWHLIMFLQPKHENTGATSDNIPRSDGKRHLTTLP